MAYIFITRKGKTNWKYILIIVILALIVIGETFYLVREEEKISEIKFPEKVVKDETLNWKTYRNEEYGFEIKYPTNWSVKKEGLGSVVSEFVTKQIEPLAQIKFVSSEDPAKTVSIIISNNSKGYSLEAWIRIYQETSPVGPSFLGQVDEFTIDENKGIKGWFGCCMTYKQTVFLTKGNKTYQIEGGIRDLKTGTYNYEEVFNQMLSTFRFLE